MKIKYFIYVAVVLFTIVLVYLILKPDYKGVIVNLSDNRFYLAPNYVDPEAEYNFPLIHIEQDTIIKGDNVSEINDLRNNQKVKIWVDDKGDKEIAEKIEVL